MKRFYVSSKTRTFLEFSSFLKNQEVEENPPDPHKILRGFFIFRRSFIRVTELYNSLNINKLSHELLKDLYNLLI